MACRAGSTTAYSFGDDRRELLNFAWYSENSNERTHPVGTRAANAFGLYDMHGNVSEWCSDWMGKYPNSPAVDPRGESTFGSGMLIRFISKSMSSQRSDSVSEGVRTV